MVKVNECKLGQGQINYLVRIENNPRIRIGRIRIQGLVRLGSTILLGLGLRYPNIRIRIRIQIRIARIRIRIRIEVPKIRIENNPKSRGIPRNLARFGSFPRALDDVTGHVTRTDQSEAEFGAGSGRKWHPKGSGTSKKTGSAR